MRSLFLSLLMAATFSLPGAAYDDGVVPQPPTPFPTAFKDYQILPDSTSPDGKYALIYPRRDVLFSLKDYALYLVTLNPFQILVIIPQHRSTLTANAHGSYQVIWLKDSSAVLVIEGTKWGPDKVVLATLRKGHVYSLSDLTQRVVEAVTGDFKNSGAEPYNEFYDFIFYSEGNDANAWRFLNSQQIAIDCILTTDPKDIVEHRWTVRFQGLWNISRETLRDIKITRLPKTP